MEEEEGALIPGPAGNNQRLTYEQWQARRRARQEAMDEARKDGPKVANLDPHGKLASEAAAEEVGSAVRYTIEERVNLPRQKAALLPLLDKSIEATRVIIFNEGVHAQHPLMGLRIKNSTSMPLTQGPVTVYDDGNYAGDARIPDLQPNEERLVSYAIDLGTEVKTETDTGVGPTMMISVNASASMDVHFTARETRKYTIRNRSKHERIMLIEYPVRAGWTLAKDQKKPRETAADVHRFELAVPADQTVAFEVAEEQERDTVVSANTSRSIAENTWQSHYVSGLGMSLVLTTKTPAPELTRATIEKGSLLLSSRHRQEHSYLVINSSTEQDRTIGVRHWLPADWRYLENGDKPVKTSGSSHDYSFKIARKQESQFSVQSEKNVGERADLTALPHERTRWLLGHPNVSVGVKDALRKLQEDRATLAVQQQLLAEMQKSLREISDEQARLRQNLEKVPSTSALHKRYLEKMEKQETEIEGLQEKIKTAQAADKRMQKELTDFVNGLTVK